MPIIIRSISIFAGAAFAALFCCAASAGESALRPAGYKDCNLLVISITNIGTEHMSLYGYGRKTTPNLEKWAEGALVFDEVFTPASWTLPAATSLFTSLPPYTHQITGRNRNMLLPEKIETLPEILKAAGYKTAAFTGGLDYMTSLGHMRGFGTAPKNTAFTKFDVTIPQAGEWLSKEKGGRFFLFVHGYDAHPPFTPSKRFAGVFSSTEGKHVTVDPLRTYRGYRETGSADIAAYSHEPRQGPKEGSRKMRGAEDKTVLTPDDMAYLEALYDEEVLDVDRAVGDFLASLDAELLDRTIVVVLSEHGEMFAKHGRFGRAGAIRGTLYDDVAHVPLMIKLPGAGGKRLRGLVQLADIMPTLLELLDLPVPGKARGVSLLPLMTANKPVNKFVYAGTNYNNYLPETYGPYGYSSVNEFVRSEKWKLIHEITFLDPKKDAAGRTAEETFELYDLEKDPGEAVNLAAERPDVAKDLALKLKRWAAASRKAAKYAPLTRDLPGEVLEKAKQHGYW